MTEDAYLRQLTRNTTRARALPMALATTKNLLTVAGKRAATAARQPWVHTPVFLVGAGPSLDRHGHLLEDCQRLGYVVACNTAVGACLAHGVQPDLVVTVESVDASSHLRGYEGPVMAGLASHAAAWERAGWWFAPTSTAWSEVYRLLGAPPLSYGGSVTTAMLSLARAWGSRAIVLLGQDMGYEDGQSAGYAEGAGWHGWDVEVKGGRVLGHGREDRDEVHDRDGIMRIARDKAAVEVRPWHEGRRVWSTYDLVAQLRWYEALPRETKKLVYNCTEGGALIRDVRHLPLADLLRELRRSTEPRHIWAQAVGPAVPQSHVDDVVTELRAQAERCLELCEQAPKRRIDWRACQRGWPVVTAYAASDLTRMTEEWRAAPPDQLANIYVVMAAAARKLSEVLGG